MTTTTLTRAVAEHGLLGTLSQFWADMRSAYARRQALAETRTALNALSDRELDDLGLTRGDIERTARAAVGAR